MKVKVIDCGNFMCDGGAAFGIIPKLMWSKEYPVDADNMINLTMRSLLADNGTRIALVDTGMGNKLSNRFLKYQYINGEGELIKSLASKGYKPEDITDVVLTHLHFDHCGGCVTKLSDGSLVPTFPNATYWTTKAQWENYINPTNIREASVSFPENMMPLFERNLIRFIEEDTTLFEGFEMRIFNGHTPGQIVPFVTTQTDTYCYTGDVIPVMASIPLAWIAAYDTFPLTSIKEKERFLEEVSQKGYQLFFQHDLYTTTCLVEKSLKGFRGIKSKLKE